MLVNEHKKKRIENGGREGEREREREKDKVEECCNSRNKQGTHNNLVKLRVNSIMTTRNQNFSYRHNRNIGPKS